MRQTGSSLDALVRRFKAELDVSFGIHVKVEKSNENVRESVIASVEPFLQDCIRIRKAKTLKNESFEFLNSIKLFGLDFSTLTNENKNTKRSLVEYLTCMYFAAIGFETSRPPSTPPSTPKLAASVPDLSSNPLSLLENAPDLWNLVSELSREIPKESLTGVNPMDILSGKKCAVFENLMKTVETRLKSKIDSGEIDSGTLEKQAQSLFQKQPHATEN